MPNKKRSNGNRKKSERKRTKQDSEMKKDKNFQSAPPSRFHLPPRRERANILERGRCACAHVHFIFAFSLISLIFLLLQVQAPEEKEATDQFHSMSSFSKVYKISSIYICSLPPFLPSLPSLPTQAVAKQVPRPHLAAGPTSSHSPKRYKHARERPVPTRQATLPPFPPSLLFYSGGGKTSPSSSSCSVANVISYPKPYAHIPSLPPLPPSLPPSFSTPVAAKQVPHPHHEAPPTSSHTPKRYKHARERPVPTRQAAL